MAQYALTASISASGAYVIVTSWYSVLFNYNIGHSFVMDMIVLAIALPLIINGLLDTLHYRAEWQIEQLRRAKSKKQALSAELEALRTHINPHFLFNSFATLSQFIKEDPKRAGTFVDDLSDVYRYVLQNRETETVLLSDEIKAIEALKNIQEARIPDSLNFNIDIRQVVASRKIPTMALYTLVENALKHNVASPGRPLTIKIYTNENDNLVVENNIQLKRTPASLGSGLNTLNRRFQLLAKQDLKIQKTNEIFRVIAPINRMVSS